MAPPHSFLTIHAEHRSDAYVIELEGELDRSGRADLEFALSEAEGTRADRIILDLERLTYIDSAGLEALLEAMRRSASNGNRLKLTRGTGDPAEMFRLTALDITAPFTEPIRETMARSRGGWTSSGLGPQSPPAEDANLPRLGVRFEDRGSG
jgi:anti-anti-sigma factor